MFASILRELNYLKSNKWDLCMVTLIPAFIIFMFSSMFYAGKAEHLPIAIIDQDQSELSRNIEKYLSLNHTVDIKTITASSAEAEQLLNETKIWVIFLFQTVLKNASLKHKMLKSALHLTSLFLVLEIRFLQQCWSVPSML